MHRGKFIGRIREAFFWFNSFDVDRLLTFADKDSRLQQ